MVRPSTSSLLLQSVTPPVAGLSKKTRLSWDSLRPPADISLARVHSHRVRRLGFGHRFPHRRSRSALVVSHHFDSFLRERAVSLLHLTTSQRFATFPRREFPNRHRSDLPGTLRRFPAARFTPLEGFPSSAAAPCHHGRCPLGVLLTLCAIAASEETLTAFAVPATPGGVMVTSFPTSRSRSSCGPSRAVTQPAEAWSRAHVIHCKSRCRRPHSRP